MAIIGFNLHKLFVERKKTKTGKINIRTNIDIKDIKKNKVDLIKGQDILSFDFEFTINYDPELASIIFGGTILLTATSKEIKETINEWKMKKIPPQIKTGIFNAILAKCSIKALALEEEMSLPPHIPMPRFSEQPQK